MILSQGHQRSEVGGLAIFYEKKNQWNYIVSLFSTLKQENKDDAEEKCGNTFCLGSGCNNLLLSCKTWVILVFLVHSFAEEIQFGIIVSLTTDNYFSDFLEENGRIRKSDARSQHEPTGFAVHVQLA